MQRVWVVFSDTQHSYERVENILGVFSTEKKAQEFAEEQQKVVVSGAIYSKHFPVRSYVVDETPVETKNRIEKAQNVLTESVQKEYSVYKTAYEEARKALIDSGLATDEELHNMAMRDVWMD